MSLTEALTGFHQADRLRLGMNASGSSDTLTVSDAQRHVLWSQPRVGGVMV
ncbi:MAG: hypothetical protein M0Z36_00670 [Thermaerobacter sp.]|nr:hypothetical protein [Thermaerobacter sp.]